MVTLMQLLLKLKHLPPCHALPLFLISRLEDVSQNIDQSFLRSSFCLHFKYQNLTLKPKLIHKVPLHTFDAWWWWCKIKVLTRLTNTHINKYENRNTQMYEPHLCAASVLPSRWMNRKLPASQTDPLRKRRSNTWLNGKEKFNLNQEAVFIGVASDITTIVAIQGRQESNTLKGWFDEKL